MPVQPKAKGKTRSQLRAPTLLPRKHLLEHLRVVLVEPQGSGNLGSVARAMAASAQELLASARTVETLQEALGPATFAVAFSGASDARIDDHFAFEALLPELSERLQQGEQIAFVFGREDKGLDNVAMDSCKFVAQITTHDVYTSLNLAQAVLLSLYGMQQACLEEGDLPDYKPTDHLATVEQRDELYQDLEKTLIQIGLTHRNAARPHMRTVRRFLERRDLTHKEVRVLRGLCRQLRWADENL